jgi:hypothetical protein
MKVRILDGRSEIGTWSMEMREQFDTTVQGEFDKWFKLAVVNLPGLASLISPEKEVPDQPKSPNTLARFYEGEGSSAG